MANYTPRYLPKVILAAATEFTCNLSDHWVVILDVPTGLLLLNWTGLFSLWWLTTVFCIEKFINASIPLVNSGILSVPLIFCYLWKCHCPVGFSFHFAMQRRYRLVKALWPVWPLVAHTETYVRTYINRLHLYCRLMVRQMLSAPRLRVHGWMDLISLRSTVVIIKSMIVRKLMANTDNKWREATARWIAW